MTPMLTGSVPDPRDNQTRFINRKKQLPGLDGLTPHGTHPKYQVPYEVLAVTQLTPWNFQSSRLKVTTPLAPG